jgi:VanZ family protein
MKSSETSRRGLAVWLWLAYWLALAASTHLPPTSAPHPGTGWDKLVHCVAFAILAILACQALPRQAVWVLLLAALIYAALDELTQRWVGRQPDALDWLADAVGILAGLWLGSRLRRRDFRAGPQDQLKSVP